ncbi:MAG: glycosyltransferase family 2 protein [Acidimicrobiales bacterium]
MTVALPSITVVTPSFNQGEYLAQAIESVLDQGYPGLEYIVLDGGSTDSSPDVIRRYERHLARWRCSPDGGQAAAIGEGFQLAKGTILAWLNADDYYEPGAFHQVAERFLENRRNVLVYGDYYVHRPDGRKDHKRKVSFDFRICLYAYLMIPQPAAFWTRDAYRQIGGIDPALHYSMDYDLFLRLAERYPGCIEHLPKPLASFRVHESSKSVREGAAFDAENRLLRARFTRPEGLAFRAQRAVQHARLEYRFVRERRMLPLRKDRSKA